MARVRPLSDLPKAIGNMAVEAVAMPQSVVTPLAANVRDEVEWQGHGYHIKGRNGRPFNLTAKVKIASENGKHKAARIVGGSPIGAWHIVEGGSSPHLITGLQERLTRRGRVAKVGARRRLSQFEAGDAINGRPLHIPGIGFRQYAVHPGHAPIGKPWQKAMKNSDGIVAKTLTEHAQRAFEKGWLK